MLRGPPDLRSDILYMLVVAGLFLVWVVLYALAIGVVMLTGRCGFQEAATRLQTWWEGPGEILVRSLKITGALALALLIIYIGIRVFTS